MLTRRPQGADIASPLDCAQILHQVLALKLDLGKLLFLNLVGHFTVIQELIRISRIHHHLILLVDHL